MSTHRQRALSLAQDQLDSGRLADALARRIAIATESEAPERAAPLLLHYLEHELRPALEGLGFAVQKLDNPIDARLPLLVAQREEDPALPTVLMYAHGDVVRGHEGQWREGLQPWVLTAEGDRWYGRGSADNKGQHSINLAALESVIAARAEHGQGLGFNVKWLFEMGEEAGSPGLREVCEAHAKALKADLFLASDGPRLRAERPTLFLGSRGAFNFHLSLSPRAGGHHSGNWGGLLANPAIELAHAVASMVDARGRLLVDALRPTALPDAVRNALADVEVGGGPNDPAIDPTWGEPGLSPAERVIGWNSLEVLAMVSGNPNQPVNAIPGRATAWCQLRFVVGLRADDIGPALRKHLDAAGFAHVELGFGSKGEASRLDPDDPWVPWALQSLAQSTGKKPALLPNLGGSLPNDIFIDVLGLPTLWVPHSYPACAQHAPNEHLLASVAREGLSAMAGLFWDLGEDADRLRRIERR